MDLSERILLRRFVDNRDSEAFSEIVKRYAEPVYNTCRRILFDEAGAADASQETFYQLMCNADSIRGSLSGWLHSVATSKAIEAIRNNSARRSRERRYTFNRSKEVNQWKDISGYIDQEIEKLPAEHKDILVQYFFEGKTMDEIAALEGISQPTVSRRINTAVETLRQRFRKRGILVSAIILASLIDQSTLQAAPAVLLTETSKMSLAGMASGLLAPSTSAFGGSATAEIGSGSLSVLSAGTVKTGITAVFSSIKAKVVTAIVFTTIGTGAVVTYQILTPKQNTILDENTSAGVQVQQIEYDVPSEVLTSRQPIVISQTSSAGGYGAVAYSSSETDRSEELTLNLPDPEMTVDTFIDLLVTNNLGRWADCFVPDSQLPADLKRIMNDPQNLAEQQLQTAFNSIGHPVEILELLETENGLLMTFLCTVFEPFEIDEDDEKKVWEKGDQFEIIAEIVCVGDQWKFSNLYANHLELALYTHR